MLGTGKKSNDEKTHTLAEARGALCVLEKLCRPTETNEEPRGTTLLSLVSQE